MSFVCSAPTTYMKKIKFKTKDHENDKTRKTRLSESVSVYHVLKGGTEKAIYLSTMYNRLNQ